MAIASKGERQNLTIRMNPDLKLKAQKSAIEEGVSLSDWMEMAVRDRLQMLSMVA
ncbi:hypothetical protein GFS31_08090 [Leptolyngbya sp. BL0902]|uniref:toxin-antitoxin system HicB family antitoxin n=1 Tax=Leptolyngbya sp. BL0902 TaxID=1115757 RepID=UPI0018E9095F|nr:hypothetical protein [Leptolyngbya sp. BL0902]QQE64130.1 hypothetical protein GFS31_08090 [Leptolyngbya sp. BL0902]